MRTKRLIKGLNNNQKIRFIVNGFIMYSTVKDVFQIATADNRNAVVFALTSIATSKDKIVSFGSSLDGVNFQVDLVD